MRNDRARPVVAATNLELAISGCACIPIDSDSRWPMVVLVVEDEAIIAYSSSAELAEAGHVVLGPARSTEEALFWAREGSPDVALIDIDLEVPGAGVALARRLSAEHDVVIVFTTGQADLARAHADCAFGVITKPYNPMELSDIVEYAVAARCGGARRTPTLHPSFERFERGILPRRGERRNVSERRHPAMSAPYLS